jgi:glycerophosphoryl diester phosphodiesterase
MDFIEFDKVKKKYKDLLEKSYYVPGVHDSNEDLNSYYSAFKEGFEPHPTAFAFWFKDENNSKSFSLIRETLDSNIPVWINTTTNNQSAGYTDQVSLLNPENGWGWVINQGARIIFTDEPEALIDYLKSKELR